ncbi:hypothetical protein EDD11_006609 [Mortierella claussenii]|nr:hypothetical protein EDD11_006609 [Mortierella claussenii]
MASSSQDDPNDPIDPPQHQDHRQQQPPPLSQHALHVDYQSFRAQDHSHPVRIPTVRHPSTGDLYVIWTDITDCFPRVVRIQHNDVYVPLMRDQDLYRVRPHGIKYHPNVILDVVYGDSSFSQPQVHPAVNRHHLSQKRQPATSTTTTHTNASATQHHHIAATHRSSHGSTNGIHHNHHHHPQGLGNGTALANTFSSSSPRSSVMSSSLRSGFSQDLGLDEATEVMNGGRNPPVKEEGKGSERCKEPPPMPVEEIAASEEMAHFEEELQTLMEQQRRMEQEDEDDNEVRGNSNNNKDTPHTAKLTKAEHHEEKDDEDEQDLQAVSSRQVANTVVQIKSFDTGDQQADKARQVVTERVVTKAQPKQTMDADGVEVTIVEEDFVLERQKMLQQIQRDANVISEDEPANASTLDESQAEENHSTPLEAYSLPVAPSAKEFMQRVASTDTTTTTATTATTATTTVAAAAAVSLASLPITAQPRHSPFPPVNEIADPNTLTIANIVRRRVQEIIKKRYRWIEASAPKLFIILPATNLFTTTNLANMIAHHQETVKKLKWSDFAVHFLCDCGHRSETTMSFAHANLKDCPWGHALTQSIERMMVNRFGDYMVAILEALRFGVVLDETDCLPAEQDMAFQLRIQLAIQYLVSQGKKSSAEYVALFEKNPHMTMNDIEPVAPLKKDVFATINHHFLGDPRRVLEDTHPILTAERDVRWVCLHHCVTMSPNEAWTSAFRFSSDPASTVTEFRTSTGAFRVVITTRERARDFYRLAQKLTTTSVLRMFLDWDLTMEDEDELRQAVSKFTAACVRIQVRSVSAHTGGVAGFGHGYSGIIFEALKNKSIEAFVMDQGLKDEPSYYGYDERYDLKRSFSSHDKLVRFKRSSREKDKVSLRILVTDIDRAVARLRVAFKGLHHFSKLNLIISDIWEYVTIHFLKAGQPGSEVEDVDYVSGDVLAWLERRGNQDSITYNCRVMGDNKFIHAKGLTTINLGYIHARDRNRMREVLKNNKRLKSVDLENLIQDDPSQIYETFKSLMANHPVLNSFEIKQRHARMSSDFGWRHMNDPNKMEVWITTHEGDKVTSMFQKYATMMKHLHVYGISAQDASVLEKVLRPKKGPFKLHTLTMMDVHLMENSALEDLRKIIMRGDFAEVKVYGDLARLKGNEDTVSETWDDRDAEAEEPTHGEQDAEGCDSEKKIVKASNSTEVSKYINNNNHYSNSNSNSSSNNSNSINSNSNASGSKKPTIPGKAAQRAIEEASIKTVDFIQSISTKLTDLNMWGHNFTKVLDILETRCPQSVMLPNLTSMSSQGHNKRLIEHKWIVQLLYYKSPALRKLWEGYGAGSDSKANGRNGISSSSSSSSSNNNGTSSSNSNGNSNSNGIYLANQTPAERACMDLATVQFSPYILSLSLIDNALMVSEEALKSPYKIMPMDDVSLQNVEIQQEDWEFLLRSLDFTRLRILRLDMTGEMKGKELNKIVDYIPSEGCPLESCSISVPGPTAEESILCQQLIKKKIGRAAEKGMAILINGYIG